MHTTHHKELVRILANIDQKLERAKELMGRRNIASDDFARAFGCMAHLEGARIRVEARLKAGK